MLLNFTLIPIAVGRLITYRARTGWLADYLVGFFGNLAIFYVLYSCVTWIQNWITIKEVVLGGFTLVLKLYFVIIALLIVLWLFLDRKSIIRVFDKLKAKGNIAAEKVKEDKFVLVYAVIFFVLLGLQCYMAFFYQLNEWSYDDYDYVVSSQDTISKDVLSYANYINGEMPVINEKRAVSSWTTYVAMLSKVSSFEVTTVCHSILPVLLLLVAYVAVYYTAKFLWEKADDRLIFMILVSMAYIFGLYSHNSTTFRLLGAIWQGKSVLTIIAVPFFTLYLVRAYKEEQKKVFLPIAAVSLGASSLTSLAIVFLPIISGVIWLIMCIYKKRVYGFYYLIASLFGTVYIGIFYRLIGMLQWDMQNHETRYFPFRGQNDWWYKWFH